MSKNQKDIVVEEYITENQSTFDSLIANRKVLVFNIETSNPMDTEFSVWKITEPNGKEYIYKIEFSNSNIRYRNPEKLDGFDNPDNAIEEKEVNWEYVPNLLKLFHLTEALGIPEDFNANENTYYSSELPYKTLENCVFCNGVEEGVKEFKEIQKEIFLKQHKYFDGSSNLPKEIYEKFGRYEKFNKKNITDKIFLYTVSNGAYIVYEKEDNYFGNTIFIGTKEEFETWVNDKYNEIVKRSEKYDVPFSIAYITRNIKNQKILNSWFENLKTVKLNIKSKKLKKHNFSKFKYTKDLLGQKMFNTAQNEIFESHCTLKDYLWDLK